ncbi:MAG: hypothetical protein BWK78_02260 [Thiotrichaceae bacterium IS1]|nr:MAG: hypothetical protein BWK78_02260 [Thiotrichaceae bacterium IS1]
MKWTKLGLIFCASGQNEWMVTGGRAPVPLYLGDDCFRIYFASYDNSGRGRVFSLELDISYPERISNLVTTPIIDLGRVGFFDDNGIIPSCVLNVDESLYLYTIGFSIKNRIIFDAATGLAVSRDGGKSFNKFSGSVIDRGVDDPCFATSPSVIREDDQWRMWYVSCDRWESTGKGYKHYYNIKHRTSQDGIYWNPQATVCIDYANEYEYAVSRPSVIKDIDGLYRMWYSFRAQHNIETYRIGYAESKDGLSWTRKDDEMSSFNVSKDGWDSEMICYPYIFEHRGRLYMLYNGNGYGKTGFGLAILEDE